MNQRVATPKFLQFQMTECGVAALGIVLSHYNCCLSLDELRQRASVTRAGLNAKDIVKTARGLGFTVKVLTREPKELPELGFPLLVHVNFGHFVVVEGMTKDHVYLNDPSCGPYKALRSDFEIEFTGVVFVVRPGPNALEVRESKDRVSWLWSHARGHIAQFIPIAIVYLCRQLSVIAFLSLVLEMIPTAYPLGMLVFVPIIALLYCMERSLRRRFGESTRAGKQDELIRSFLAKDYPFYTYRLPGVLLQTMDKLDDLADFIGNQLSNLLLVICSFPLWLGVWWIYVDIAGIAPILLFIGALWNLLDWDRLREPLRSRARQYELLYKTNARLSLDGLESHMIGAGAASMSSGLTGSYSELMLTQRALDKSRQKATVYAVTVALLSSFALVMFDLQLFEDSFTKTTLFLVITNFFFFGELLPLAKGGFEATIETLERFDELTEKSSLSRPELESKLNEEDLAGWRRSFAKIEGGLLRAESVSFAFSPKHGPLFQDLTLSIDSGEQVGLSGRSGAGKSTLAAILAGLLTPTSGELFLADRSRLIVGEAQWTNQVSWVSPAPFLFEGSLRDNLSFWDSNLSDEDLVGALKDAQLYSTIMERPGKLDCKVEYRGLNFSRGQQQRLEIARAILGKPQILILDEALDALEEDLERAIRSRLREQGVALLIISHREETLRACDRVYKLEKGALIDDSETGGEATVKKKRRVSSAEENSNCFNPSSTKTALEELNGGPLNFTGLDSSPSVLSLARGVGVVLRPIDLRGKDWWREIEEPILAVTAKDQRSVILWPGKTGLGKRVEESNEWCRLSKDEIEEFEDIAYARLQSLPEEVTGLGSLMSWLLVGQDSRLGSCLLAVIAASCFLALLPIFLDWFNFANQLEVHSAWIVLAIFSIGCGTSLWALFGNERRLFEEASFKLFPALWLRLLTRRIAKIKSIRPLELIQHTNQLLVWKDGTTSLSRLLIIAIFLGLVLILSFSMQLALLTVVAVLFGGGLWGLFSHVKLVREDGRRLRSRTRSYLFSLFCSVARLRGAGAEAIALRQWRGQNSASLQTLSAANAPLALLNFYEILGFVIFLGLSRLVLGSMEDVGLGVTMLSWLFFLGTVGFLRGVLNGLESRESWRVLKPLLNSPVFGGDSNKDQINSIEVTDLSLTFPGLSKAVFKNLSFAVQPGEVVAITGGSGAGKSTLLRALLGFLECEGGSVRFGGVSLDELNPDQLRRHIAFVSQNERLSPANVKMNVAHEEFSSLGDVREALRLACIDEEVESWHRGITTFTAEGQVSTGQKQRILLARAFCKKPQILFLDEATSACQESAERQILENIRKQGISCILVTHRKRTLAHVDRCLELKNGQLEERDLDGLSVSS